MTGASAEATKYASAQLQTKIVRNTQQNNCRHNTVHEGVPLVRFHVKAAGKLAACAQPAPYQQFSTMIQEDRAHFGECVSYVGLIQGL